MSRVIISVNFRRDKWKATEVYDYMKENKLYTPVMNITEDYYEMMLFDQKKVIESSIKLLKPVGREYVIYCVGDMK